MSDPQTVAGAVERWWITTGLLGQDGTRKILGPFRSQELALAVRAYMEKAEDTSAYWVDCDE